MSLAISKVPVPVNEPVRSYAPGTPERASLQAALAHMSGERTEMPLVIDGKDVRTGRLGQAVMPHRHAHVLGDFHHRHEIPLAGDRIDLRHALDPSQLRRTLGDSLRFGLDQYDGGNHGCLNAAIFGERRCREAARRQDI